MNTTNAFRVPTVEDLDQFFVRHRLDRTQGVVIAFSGGSDSLSLAILLSQYVQKEKLIAVYVDHGLRPSEELQQEIKLNRTNCAAVGIDLEVVELGRYAVSETARLRNGGIEDAARYLRRNALQQVAKAKQFAYIATGHTSDDQVETVLMSMLQGGFLSGPKGILAVSPPYIRPLLEYSKEAIRSVVRQRGLSWSEDSTNAHDRYLRNAIRHQIVPEIASVFPSYRTALSAVAEQTQANTLFLNESVRKASDTVLTQFPHGIEIQLDSYLDYCKTVRYGILYEAWNRLQQLSGNFDTAYRFPYASVRIADSLIAEKKHTFCRIDLFKAVLVIDYSLALFTSNTLVKRIKHIDSCPLPLDDVFDNSVCFHKIALGAGQVLYRARSGQSEVIADHLSVWIDETLLEQPVAVRAYRNTDTISLAEGTKRIVDLFSQWKIPTTKRKLIPIIEDQKGIVAVLGRATGGRDRLSRRMLSDNDLDRKRLTLYSVEVQKD